MANVQRNFIAGRMNKSLDERLLPNGEYTNALNVRLGSTEQSEVGSVENSKGNSVLTQLAYINGVLLSDSARCIGAFDDSARATIYWFVHDPAFTNGNTGKLDLIVSFNVETGGVNYHVISIDNGFGQSTTLNFNPEFLITGIDKIDDLLFFTDNFNPPRVININRNYANPVNNVDQFDSREIQVVKQPPLSAPTVQLIKANNEDTYLTENFICFAYRYKYSNDEYSAPSQFSEPAFLPSGFSFSPATFANQGMLNSFNAAIVRYNSGGKLVKGIDILFKEANDPTIKVIQRLDKAQNSIPDNSSNEQITFDAAQIFSILPEAEILRLYDNVPTLAKAQTLMANRLVYGNYVEGYDLVDVQNKKVNLDFVVNGSSEGLGESVVPITIETGVNYTAFSDNRSITDSKLVLDFNNLTSDFVVGAQISIDFTFIHSQFFGSPTTTGTTPSTSIGFTYILSQDFTASSDPLGDLIASADFKAKFGSIQADIQTVANAQAGTGITLTDLFNNSLSSTLTTPTYDLQQTGISSSTAALPSKGEPLSILQDTTNTNALTIQILAAQYLENGGSNTFIEYYKFTSANVSIRRIGNTSSLHSNRGYEVGIIYMDSFNRASTALVSKLNTVNFPCSTSSTKNTINVSIPASQRAPSFATRYKFCIKADKDTYDTIYTSLYFQDPNSNEVFFLLQGDNINKVNIGDDLIVKRDASGPLRNCTTTQVLDVAVQSADFIDPKDSAGNDIPVPGGTYMKLNNINFAAETTVGNIIDVKVDTLVANDSNRYPMLAYPLFDDTVPGLTNGNYDLPVGSEVRITVDQNRQGVGAGVGACERRTSILDHTFICSETYSNWEEFVQGENFEGVIENNAIVVPDVAFSGNNPVGNIFINSVASAAGAKTSIQNGSFSDLSASTVFGGDTDSPSSQGDLTDNNYYRLYKDTSTSNYYLMVSGTRCCGNSTAKRSRVTVNITVFRREAEVIFETKPVDALPDLWYEGSQSFSIDSIGQHSGNVVNQNIAQGVAATVSLNFSNCFTFGNGVESYKIQDSSSGKQFNLGNRTFTTNNTTFQQAHRFADLTYSGVFNDETNVNKLNEFNLGLANFKPLEETFGDVEILFARKDDILVLQEDKISYVLAGKDLLTDATGGGQLTAVPSVLGKQIARIENYGISNNPESFAVWGESKYFTDGKRSAVIHLIGSSAQNERLEVISEAGMRSFFRDLFTKSFTTQKLGAYDPYMNEYVLTSNTILKPEVAKCTACGVSRDVTIPAGQEILYCVDLEPQEGTVVVRYEIPTEGPQNIITEATSQNIITEGGDDITTEGGVGVVGYTISATYNNNVTTTGVVYTSGTFTFEKNVSIDDQVLITLSSNSTVADTIEVTVECPSGTLLNVYSVCVTSASDAGKFIHNELSWSDGYLVSSTQSDLVPFGTGTGSFVISQYKKIVGDQGVGSIPTNGSVMTLGVNKIKFDDFVFDTANNSLGFVRTNTIYSNTEADITTLLGLETTIPINNLNAPELYTGSFTVPTPTTTENHLYLIYDYRNASVPTPTPTPSFDFSRYTECQGPNTVVFRASVGYSFPAVVRYQNICYQTPTPVSVVSSIDIPTGSDEFTDCPTCIAAAPTPTPTPTNAPAMTTNTSTNIAYNAFTANGSLDTANGTVTERGFYIGTDSLYSNNTKYIEGGTSTGSYSYYFGAASQSTTYYVTAYAINEHGIGVGSTITTTTTAPTYVYATYLGCEDSLLIQIFRVIETTPFPNVIKYNGICYSYSASTSTTSSVDVTTDTFDNCDSCVDDPPDPPVPSSFTSENFTIQLCDGTGSSYIVTINNIPTSGSTTISDFIVNASVRLNGNYGQPVSSYPQFDGDANYKITAVGTANPLVTLTYVGIVADCTDWPSEPPPTPSGLYYFLVGCTRADGTNFQGGYKFLTQAPQNDQRFVDGASGTGTGQDYDFYRYDGRAGLETTSDRILGTDIIPVGGSFGCPVYTPPVPAPSPTPTTIEVYFQVRECYAASSATTYYYKVTNWAGDPNTPADQLQGVLDAFIGRAMTVSGGNDDSKYWEIVGADQTQGSNYTVTYVTIQSSCEGFTPPPTPPAPTPPPVPPIIYGQYLACDGADDVAYVSAPSGTTFPNVLKISGICYQYSSLGGSSGALYTNYDDFTTCFDCQQSVPSPPPPSPPTPTCFAINNMSTGSSATLACNPSRYETMYFNNSSFCQASNFFRTDANCGTSVADTYVSNGSYYRQWSSGQFGPCLICQQQ